DLEMIYPKMEGLQNFNSISRINNEQSMYCTPMGAYLCDNAGNINPNPFLPGKKISHSISDTEGNTWFSTLGEGVYRMTSQTMKTYVPGREVFCIEEVNQIIYCGF